MTTRENREGGWVGSSGEAEAKLWGLLESAPDAIVAVNGEGQIVLANAQTTKMFGYSRTDLLGKSFDTLMAVRRRERQVQDDQPTLRGMGIGPVDKGLNLTGQRNDGSEFPIEISLSPVETGDGTIVMGIIRDITVRKRLEEELRIKNHETAVRAKQLSALYTVTATANESLDLDLLLQEMVKKIVEIFRFDCTKIVLFDAGRDELGVRACCETKPGVFSQTTVYQRGQGNVGRVAETGKPLIFEDVQSDARYQRLSRSKRTQRVGYSFLGVFPIKSKLRIRGAMVCVHRLPRRLTPDEIQLITSMAGQIAIAVENSLLFEETRARANELAALYSVATVLNRSLDITQVLPGVMQRILQIFAFDAARVYLLDKDQKELRLLAQEGVPEDITLPESYRSGQGITGKVFETGRPLIFEDTQTDPEFHRLSRRRLALPERFRSHFFIPIGIKGKTVGVMNFFSASAHRFSPGEIQMIDAIANQIGIAVENGNLFAEVRKKTAALETLNLDLQEASRAKTEFTAAMSHEIKTPLQVIIGYSDLILRGFLGEISPRQKDAMGIIHRHSEMLLKLVESVLTLEKISIKKMGLDISNVRLEEIMKSVRSYAEHLDREGRLKFVWKVDEDLPTIATDLLKLEEILQNLIGNAYKFTQEGKIEVRVRDLQEERRVEFTVADSGVGIEEVELARIFDAFHQGAGARTGDNGGVGLGLNIVKRYLELMHGDIGVKSQPGMGTTFTFTLPYSI